ncbi:MAG: tetratricopeptide repeat protein [Gammaproteobacteria bacterium]|nr:tetratricopeptide repeat protein [Gammaproteobacteria bacterium]MDH3481137.1 tetratricopeptide repeat protein [Gammaproteobacteria bacterium]
MKRHAAILVSACAGLAACATTTSNPGTLAELESVQADVDEVYLDDSLDRAAESYRRYLEETTESARTPEAMRRLADLQIEQAYGVIGSGELVEMEAPDRATQPERTTGARQAAGPIDESESEQEFEKRATQRQQLLSQTATLDAELPGGGGEPVPSGPREAIKTYQTILETYPNYERNDKVLYQMSRAYDEIGQPDEAMQVMDRLVADYPYSKYVDEVYFRRGEYFFVRKKYRAAEDAYGSIIRMGATSPYYELALYKLGWTLYKQEFYEEALQNYMAMLDYRQSIGFDFDENYEENDEHRVADTFRVISLSFSNLGGPEFVDEYFAENGQRSYADKIYSNLGEFYFTKLRYDDAASVYKSFIKLNPFHKISPHFSMRVVEIYGEADFPLLVVESKKEFASIYALDAEYWSHFDIDNSTEVIGFLKTNLTDLAGHYHAIYQDENFVDDKPASFSEAQHWYREFLNSFPADAESPQINYQLADLLLENEDFGESAVEYERTAYDYGEHEQASAAGYAAIYAHRQNLETATGARRVAVRESTVTSSLRFADTFQEHEQAPVVLGKAADDLYDMEDFNLAIQSAQTLIDRYPAADALLIRSAWAVIAHSSIDLAEYEDAEHAYMNVLALTAAEDETRPAVVDGLAAAIYKQGEQANLLEDYRVAAEHFLRIKDIAPGSNIRTSAEYDAAVALMKLQDWTRASAVLEEFRTTHPEHELGGEATKQLAFIYREAGQTERSAAEHERIAAESTDPELGREALLIAAELYDEAHIVGDAIRVYEEYVARYPQPLDIAMETRSRLAEILKAELEYEQYHAKLAEIIAVDRDAGALRTDRSRFLAARAALILAELDYQQFVSLELMQPFEESLAEKQRRMDKAMAAFESLVDYEVAEVTAAATFYIAEIYFEFSAALLESERPAGLSDAEKVDYEMVIEEEAYPFEERAIEVHEANFELLANGIFNPWVQKSLDKLAGLMPGRYAKNEISGGFLGSIDTYAYRMPIAVPPGVDAPPDDNRPESGDTPASPEATAQISGGSEIARN